jgi:hypothetical protein
VTHPARHWMRCEWSKVPGRTRLEQGRGVSPTVDSKLTKTWGRSPRRASNKYLPRDDAAQLPFAGLSTISSRCCALCLFKTVALSLKHEHLSLSRRRLTQGNQRHHTPWPKLQSRARRPRMSNTQLLVAEASLKRTKVVGNDCGP